MEQTKKKENIVLVVLVMTAACLVSLSALAVFLWFFFSGGRADITTDITQYGQFDDFPGYSRLYVFPETLPPSAGDITYEYNCRDTFLDPTCQVYLEYTSEADDYRAEVERLSQIQESYRSQVNTIRHDDEHFQYPARVAVYRFNHTYEYALLQEEEKRIAYVFTQFIAEEDIVFPPSYLPDDFSTQPEDALSGFSLYAFPMENGTGYYMSY